ncbi:hypothetical protein E1B28_002949 [Marasmius oreades]|uniref:Uncharacterized protein n=1 Tax=Marasmius oreades TaxID=181124 RepID=A0A9P7UK25_9AGAR|nr:uncharacterized protein E1B28_002949 [Marasmius oreades]KAG7085385.1 hypothetical protein E1B28_002949 [Marasmius oreades]
MCHRGKVDVGVSAATRIDLPGQLICLVIFAFFIIILNFDFVFVVTVIAMDGCVFDVLEEKTERKLGSRLGDRRATKNTVHNLKTTGTVVTCGAVVRGFEVVLWRANRNRLWQTSHRGWLSVV